MNKSLVALIAALIAAATTFSSAAEAGLKIRLGFGGPLPHFTAHGHGHHHYKRKLYIARRVAKKKKVYVAKKATPSMSKVTKVEKKVSKPQVVATAPVVDEEVDVIADNENSSITSAALEPIEDTAAIEPETTAPAEVKAAGETAKVEAKPEKAASKLDCKKFFPSVGMTLTVPCE
ncbi:MAG: hypothetical protein K8F92_09815 [Hyphomicrobium sp.]|uniref:hypothetical protein n=1 Tax=Hyphomicrobium sp. TaxID=82 RepID=UPI001329E846|nr:hypothetical protein [Hyphomicrobium sp.]KAB2939313.1 MAG: hypothetical protein F9K20_17615 [Hyphomicrobium sp.]MBZ0209934.1 hypothetical protein [Hyphomicrobium sp.]